ncbi:hypothetical protein E0F15_15580 [Frankia sp. B2]|uniref:rhomboid-like protein n=2 Tax=Frankia TaxID=1854 RepID=UPI00046206C7|nr:MULTISPECIES: rhomboid-like protein [unclassified Frankia]KDA41325.1 hypothetical protein BMG523Draft_03868 [Frankia sp. BMG5.23]KEZ34866.1 hypothetical protein CEDDRAFT_03796 [Frankia sp. CeD]TFE28018.1 hypothetical protein E0F15_15580 [Frankia sp. B2]
MTVRTPAPAGGDDGTARGDDGPAGAEHVHGAEGAASPWSGRPWSVVWRLPVTVGRFPVTDSLLGALVAARVFQYVDPATATRWQWAMSTTFDQMRHHPLGVLVGSIPWLPEGPLAPWLMFAGLAVGGLEATAGGATALAVVLGGHAGATLISQGVLDLRVVTGGLPRTALHVLDVGPSYVVATALTALVVLPSRRSLRALASLTFVVVLPVMMKGVSRGDLDAVGHTAALALGALAGLAPPVRRRAAARRDTARWDAARRGWWDVGGNRRAKSGHKARFGVRRYRWIRGRRESGLDLHF